MPDPAKLAELARLENARNICLDMQNNHMGFCAHFQALYQEWNAAVTDPLCTNDRRQSTELAATLKGVVASHEKNVESGKNGIMILDSQIDALKAKIALECRAEENTERTSAAEAVIALESMAEGSSPWRVTEDGVRVPKQKRKGKGK